MPPRRDPGSRRGARNPRQGNSRKAASRQPELVGGPLWRIRRWLFAVVLVVCAAAAVGVYQLSRIPLPAAKPLQETTFVYDSTGHNVLASFSEQNRVAVSLSQVPPVLVEAVVSTEDRHFFTEGALNPVSMIRAAVADLSGSGGLQGASTITQQYVKQTYLTPQRSLSRKIKEAALSIRLSRTESKDQILQGYLNTIYWGRGAYGIEAASQAYFGVDVEKLNLPEAALLAGLIREPDSADPAHDPALAHLNQTDTLDAMVRDGHITDPQAKAAAAVPYSRYVVPPSGTSGVASSSSTNGEAYFVEAVRQELYAKYGAQVVDGGGLRVTTTLDPTLQSKAYTAIYGPDDPNSLNPRAGEPSGALISLDDNGEVKAMVGGQDYDYSTVNLALGRKGGGSGRQAGSTFKAIMLAELLREGYSPESVFPAPPEVELPHGNEGGGPWTVTNFEHEQTAPQVSLIDATALSINTVYAQVVARIGADKLVSMAEALGISASEIGAYPSLVLGTASVSPLEMAAAYATFASGGVYHAPLLITRVTDSSGKVLPLPVQPQSRVVLTPAQAAEETYVLQQVVLRGTGVGAGGIGSPVAGKTGTTENSGDAWFIGYTPNLTTAVWMGYASGNKPMVDFRGLTSVQGGTIPATLWHDYMYAALQAEPQYAGTFPPVYFLGGMTLTPPPAGSLVFPEGMGTTTTTSTTTPTTTTTVPSTTTTTTRPHSTTTTATTAPPTTPPTTRPPPVTTTPTTKPAAPTTTTPTRRG